MKKYRLFIVTLITVLVGYWYVNFDPRVNALNEMLLQDTEIAQYPYQFKVLKLENGTAVLSSPRSSKVSVLKFLSIIKPELPLHNPDNPDVIAAQKEMAKIQQKAKKLVLAQSDIHKITWTLDKAWFADYGILID
ncbi:MAG: hypothetical protein KAI17_04985 [Thiotrichaceae bacterium]|nr:hypothetical protein [Thiotrichaceae bacterium]